MAGSLNKVMLIGHLGADPEVRSFANGGRACNLRVATGESWTDRQTGERRERTEWHQVVIRSGENQGGMVGAAERYLRKGSKIYVEGVLQTRKWQDQAGQDRYSTEIVLSGPRAVLNFLDRSEGQGGAGRSGSAGSSAAGAPAGQSPGDGLYDDEIPF